MRQPAVRRTLARLAIPVTGSPEGKSGVRKRSAAPIWLEPDRPKRKSGIVNAAVPSSVGVLLATYDGAAYCEDQIISLLWQRGVDVHIYVRDDGSRDATGDIVARLAARHPDRITIVNNHGVLTGSAAGNFFALLAEVNLAQHSYIAFADQDDVWLPDKLYRAIAAMTTIGADGYSSNLIAYHQDDSTAWVVEKQGEHADLDYLFQGASAGCTYVLSLKAAQLAAAVMTKAPPLCAGASHDWIVYAICRTHGLTWFRDRAAGIMYRQHAANQYGTRRGFAEIAAKFQLIRSGWYKNQILWLRNVLRGSDDERHVLAAIDSGDMRSRWWLLRQAPRFRRTPQAVMQLRAAITLGAI
ncbi:MAG: glycosyltransferase [Oxalobacteraceae bacterium]|nr:MAG: glycosyltransferase [Oxalobacteraceae bacterium]